MADFYALLLTLHGYWRWVVLLAVGIAILTAFVGWRRHLPFAPAGRRAAALAIAALDIQFLAGLVLYGVSPLVRSALANMGAAMKQQESRFFAVEHLVAMFIAVAVAHAGLALGKRAAEDGAKYRRIFAGFAVSLAIICASTPWWRPLFRSMIG